MSAYLPPHSMGFSPPLQIEAHVSYYQLPRSKPLLPDQALRLLDFIKQLFEKNLRQGGESRSTQITQQLGIQPMRLVDGTVGSCLHINLTPVSRQWDYLDKLYDLWLNDLRNRASYPIMISIPPASFGPVLVAPAFQMGTFYPLHFQQAVLYKSSTPRHESRPHIIVTHASLGQYDFDKMLLQLKDQEISRDLSASLSAQLSLDSVEPPIVPNAQSSNGSVSVKSSEDEQPTHLSTSRSRTGRGSRASARALRRSTGWWKRVRTAQQSSAAVDPGLSSSAVDTPNVNPKESSKRSQDQKSFS